MLLFTPYTYNPGISLDIYLPLNGDSVNFKSYFQGLSGLPGTWIPDCYDKYGISWKWSQFTCTVAPFSAATLASYQPIYPKTWADVQCSFPGTFPKTWGCEGADWSVPGTPFGSWGPTAPDSAFLFSPNPLPVSATPITWTLSSPQWSSQNSISIHPDISQEFPFNLKFFNNGTNYETTNYLKDTIITLDAKVTVSEIDTRVCPPSTNHFQITHTLQITAHSPPIIDVYTPNRYVLSGSLVEFENLTTKLHFVTAFNVDFDDGVVKFITNVNNNFTSSYFKPGTKTLQITAFTSKWPLEPIIAIFPDIITVVPRYEDFSEENFRSPFEVLNLPWKTPPTVKNNDWVVASNINFTFQQILDNLNYLNNFGKYYNWEFLEYFGYLGPQPDPFNASSSLSSYLTWQDLNGEDSNKLLTWKDFYWSGDPLDTMTLSSIAKWSNQEVTSLGKDICDDVAWNVNIENIIDPSWVLFIDIFDRKYDKFRESTIRQQCTYKSIFSKNNVLYINTDKVVKVLNKDKNFSYYSSLSSFDGLIEFENIASISVDSQNRIFVLDSDLLQIGVYTLTTNYLGERVWSQITNWGGLGKSRNKFLNPIQLFIDHKDCVWVIDEGSQSIKHFTNTGSWLKTLENLKGAISLSQDSQNNIHILTNSKVLVYSYEGNFLFDYDFSIADPSTPRHISANYSKEIFYITFENQVAKFFRNGAFGGLPIKSADNITNINGTFQDEYRNVLVLSNDKILKYVDIPEKRNNKGSLPSSDFWKPSDIYINPEEFIQNWVYNKSFSKLWDNIEIFKNHFYHLADSRIFSLSCSDLGVICDNTKTLCKKYFTPIHNKEKLIIGQNEIVTSVVINRNLKYLWENLEVVIYFVEANCNLNKIFNYSNYPLPSQTSSIPPPSTIFTFNNNILFTLNNNPIKTL
jgi:hypothetical protein